MPLMSAVPAINVYQEQFEACLDSQFYVYCAKSGRKLKDRVCPSGFRWNQGSIEKV